MQIREGLGCSHNITQRVKRDAVSLKSNFSKSAQKCILHYVMNLIELLGRRVDYDAFQYYFSAAKICFYLSFISALKNGLLLYILKTWSFVNSVKQ